MVRKSFLSGGIGVSGLLAALMLVLAPVSASATVIDFESLPLGNNLNPLALPGATFTTIGGFNYISTIGTSALCTSTSAGSPANCSRDLEVVFDAASSGISFEFAANNNQIIGADIGDVQIFAGLTLLGVVNVVVIDANGLSFDLVNLAGFSGVTRLLISSTDLGGVLYDNFTFTSSTTAVPEPASWQLMATGLGLAGAAFRRRRTLKSLSRETV